MAGLSIARRRKAWISGVTSGAMGKGNCRYLVPKLKEIFEHGMAYARSNAETSYVKALVEGERRRRQPRRPVQRQPRQRPFRPDRSTRF